jgi:cytochrome c biogenesis protein CcmG/thiol:disulfide interchange protein DsbE
MSARTFAVTMGVLAVLGLLVYGVVSKGHGSLQAGDAAPVAELPALGGTAGQTGSVADYKGKWVLVNVWASWCEPCRDEAPELERFYREHQGDNFEILGVDTKDDQGSAQKFVDEFDLTYPQLHDGSGDYADNDLKTTGVPENFLVDPSGNVAVAIHGQVTPELLNQQIAPRLESS